MPEIRLMTWNPGHFHAALVQKEMMPGVSPTVHVFAPLGPDLLNHLGRIAGFNSRRHHPTNWELEVHASEDSLARMLERKPGNVVVISGRNRGKIDAIVAALGAGLHVLADKPWVIDPADLPKLARSLELARTNRLVALDIMTERFEVTARLLRALVHDEEVFGTIDPGTPDHPSVFMESEHYLYKYVAGVPLRRPPWFFDVEQQGEGLSDVGTHLVDLVPWVLFPGQAVGIDEIEMGRATRAPTILSRMMFQRVTGEADFPPDLARGLVSGQLLYHCNTTLAYALRGVHVWLNIAWSFEAGPKQGDRHFVRVAGSRAAVEIRQGEPEHFRPEVYIVPREPERSAEVGAAVTRLLERETEIFPGVRLEREGKIFRLEIPDRLRVGHEAHFGEVLQLFLQYRLDPSRVPAWEEANMNAKYHVTTHGVRLARQAGTA
jgi:predicted dehydrogenase